MLFKLLFTLKTGLRTREFINLLHMNSGLKRFQILNTRIWLSLLCLHSTLLPKAEPMIFVGYSDVHKAYKCFDETTLTEVYSPHVTFDERIRTSTVEYPTNFAEHIAPIERPGPVQSSSNSQESQSTPMAGASEDEQSDEDVASPQSGVDINFDVQQNLEEDDIDPLVSYMVRPELTAFMSMPSLDDSPTYEEAMRGPHAMEFNAAIQKEYRSLAENKVFSEPMILPKESEHWALFSFSR
jgi:hypothetical protein